MAIVATTLLVDTAKHLLDGAVLVKNLTWAASVTMSAIRSNVVTQKSTLTEITVAGYLTSKEKDSTVLKITWSLDFAVLIRIKIAIMAQTMSAFNVVPLMIKDFKSILLFIIYCQIILKNSDFLLLF